MEEKFNTRFIIDTDLHCSRFIFDLPETWPFRYYEYIWASTFVEPEDVVLDAASGVCHPLKFFLSQECKEVHACDIDDRILKPYYILKEVEDTFGVNAAASIPHQYFHSITYEKANLTALPYSDKKFNKVFCISVIEHMKREDIRKCLAEFNRIVKDDGLIILTCDYPTINLEFLKSVVEEVGLEFAGEVFFEIPKNAIYTPLWGGFYCIRTVLKKKITK